MTFVHQSKIFAGCAIALVMVVGWFDKRLTAGELFEPLNLFAEQRIDEFSKIPEPRKKILNELAQAISAQSAAGNEIKIVFVCTHNSRRSQMSQCIALMAAKYFHIEKVSTYSGGVDPGAFNKRAIDTLSQAGFQIKMLGEDAINPRYMVMLESKGTPSVLFSKRYADKPNPKDGFIAVMNCGEADKECPTVEGATNRIALTYKDPKSSDGSDQEAEVYASTRDEIAREWLFVFSKIKPGI